MNNNRVLRSFAPILEVNMRNFTHPVVELDQSLNGEKALQVHTDVDANRVQDELHEVHLSLQ